MQDATRQGKILSFFFMKRKESCARKRGGGEKEGRGGGRREEGRCLTFFKGIINSLSALVRKCNCIGSKIRKSNRCKCYNNVQLKMS